MIVKEIAAAIPGSPKLSMVRLVEKDIRPCKACYRCLTGDCPHQDDFSGVLRAIMEADAVIVAAPAYLRGTHSCLQRFLDRGLQAYRHVDALYGKPAVAVATAGVEDGEGSALLGIENFIRQLGLSLKGRAVVRATFPGDAIVFEEGRNTARRLAAALVSPDDYAPEGVSCPECKGTYFEFRGEDCHVLPLVRGHRNIHRGGRERPPGDRSPRPLLADEGGDGVAREVADRPAGRVPSPEGTAEGRGENVPWGGVHLMRKDGRETRRNVIEKSLQIFSVKGYYNASIGDIMAATGLTKGGLYAHFGSKEALWNAAYERAVEIWRGIVFKGVRKVSDPLDRIAKTIENDLRDYCCGEVFEGGCFFFNSLVELSGQSPAMSGEDRRGIHAVLGPSGFLAGRGEVRRQANARREDQGGRRFHRHLHQRRGRVVRRDPEQPVPPGDRAAAERLHPDAEGIKKGNRGSLRRVPVSLIYRSVAYLSMGAFPGGGEGAA